MPEKPIETTSFPGPGKATEPSAGQKIAPKKRGRFIAAIAVTAVVAVVLAVVISRCNRSAPKPPPGVPVRTATAVRKAMPVSYEFMGCVEAFNALTVIPQVDGRVKEIHFKEGGEIAPEQLLFTIDPAPFQEQLNLDEASLARAEAELKLMQCDARRSATLLEQGVISSYECEHDQTAATAQEATVRAARAAVEQARLNLGYCSVRSPIPGRAGAFLVNIGAVVESQKTQMVAVNQIRPLRIAFCVPEGLLPAVREAQARGTLQVEAWAPEAAQEVRAGEVTFIDNAVDTATGTLRMKGTFANEDAFFWPGQYVRVNLTLDRQPQALVVPLSAVQTNPKGSFLFVVQPDMTAALRPVKVDRTAGQEVVLSAGLDGGETVVTDGQNKLRDGSRVSLADAPAPGGSPQQPAARP